jgi:uncharacterized protein involved in outer membrane biogenesis
VRWLQGRSRTEKLLVGTATALVIVVASFLLFLALVDWNAMRGPVGRFLSDRVGRTVEIRGPLEVDVWSLRPRMQAHDVAVGNAPWDRSEKLMGTVARVDVQMELLPLLRAT